MQKCACYLITDIMNIVCSLEDTTRGHTRALTPGTHILRLRQTHIYLFFLRALKQIRAATQHTGDARWTRIEHVTTLQLRRLTDFFTRHTCLSAKIDGEITCFQLY